MRIEIYSERIPIFPNYSGIGFRTKQNSSENPIFNPNDFNLDLIHLDTNLWFGLKFDRNKLFSWEIDLGIKWIQTDKIYLSEILTRVVEALKFEKYTLKHMLVLFLNLEQS